MKAPPRFRYTDQEWDKIADDLPRDSDHAAVRMWMEATGAAHRNVALTFGQHVPSTLEQIASHRRLAINARKFIESFAEYLAYTSTEEPYKKQLQRRELLLAEIRDLAEQQEQFAIKLEGRGRTKSRGRKGDFGLDFLWGEQLKLWLEAGGDIGTSEGDDGAGGPLVRFLVNAATPILRKEVTRGAARWFVRKFVRKAASGMA